MDAIFWDGNGVLYVIPSNGSGFDYNGRAYHNQGYFSYSKSAFADVNGDGKVDAIFWDGNGVLYVIPSNGSGFDYNGRAYHNQGYFSYSKSAFADVTGDGKADAIFWNGNNDLYVVPSDGPIPDLLSSISNGIGATTNLTYKPSSSYTNTLLPFITQTLSSVTIDDGNGNQSTTTYDYSGGDFSYAEREFRGFEYVTATAPNGTYTTTRYLQDDIFKSLPADQETRDLSDNLYARSVNTFNSSIPYTGVVFPYLESRLDEVYDGTASPKQAQTDFEYDQYGNITRKYLHGDLADPNDQRDEYTEYYYDLSNWIVSLPSHTYVEDPTGPTPVTVAEGWFTYDSRGNLLTRTSWLDGGTNPVTTYTYDDYGNVETITDPNNNPPAIITYDTTAHTYPVTVQNPLGHTVQKTYDYKYGKVLTETDPNGNTTTYEYDEFGRILKVIGPKDSVTYPTITYEYPALEDYGQIDVQKVKTYAREEHGQAGIIWSEAYFDGIGRTIKTRSEGPDSKVVVTETTYNDRGLISGESLPYFEGLETAGWTAYEYDPIGRITMTTYPDTTYATADYMKGILTYIDSNGHKKVEEKDIYGRIVKIEEYTGDEATGFTLYATTLYEYDISGNLTKVIDAQNNQTSITYDTLSRKTSMDDPDMGHWEYNYDANGNLVYQIDAKLQEITFEYDALSRITRKNYPDLTYVQYTYDESFSTYSTGRPTTLTDASGTTKFYYDVLGNAVKTIKTIDSVDYITETTYDAIGRTATLTYPDGTVIKYEYNTGGSLYKVTNSSGSYAYAEYSSYNALGQYGLATFGNGVTTTYQYRTDNNRLNSITTNSPSAGSLINLTYNYDSVGNITGITDSIDSTKTRTFVYDELDRLTEANSTSYGGSLIYQYDKVGNMKYNCRYGDYQYDDPDHIHAVTSVTKNGQTIDSYTYDANGNMETGAGRTFTYDYDNMPTSIAVNSKATLNVYDATGQRVKKIIPESETTFRTTTYIGKLYECTEGECEKYIFAGSERIAKIDDTETYFYHSDHLGSSTVITDNNADIKQEVFYYPFGEIKTNTGSDIASHKFTGQEFDGETGLYYYNARYYDPKLARFVSADTIVPDPRNPQALNRYSYVINNPIKYIDPSGHGWLSDTWEDIKDWASDTWEDVKDFVSDNWQYVAAGAAAVLTFGTVAPAAYSFLAFGNLTTAASVASYSAHIALTATSYAIGGAAAGAVGAGIMGGNIGQGALIGAVTGGIYGLGGALTGGNGLLQIGLGGLAGGTASEMSGGKFSEGFKIGAISSFIMYEISAFRDYSKDALRRTAERVLNVEGWTGQITNTQWKYLNGAFSQRGFIINVIRRFGSCITCPQLRFSNAHFIQSPGVLSHWDPYDPVTDFPQHIACDYWKLC